MRERVIMTRLLRGRAPGREFDIAFWQAMGPSRILEGPLTFRRPDPSP